MESVEVVPSRRGWEGGVEWFVSLPLSFKALTLTLPTYLFMFYIDCNARLFQGVAMTGEKGGVEMFFGLVNAWNVGLFLQFLFIQWDWPLLSLLCKFTIYFT